MLKLCWYYGWVIYLFVYSYYRDNLKKKKYWKVYKLGVEVFSECDKV